MWWGFKSLVCKRQLIQARWDGFCLTLMGHGHLKLMEGWLKLRAWSEMEEAQLVGEPVHDVGIASSVGSELWGSALRLRVGLITWTPAYYIWSGFKFVKEMTLDGGCSAPSLRGLVVVIRGHVSSKWEVEIVHVLWKCSSHADWLSRWALAFSLSIHILDIIFPAV